MSEHNYRDYPNIYRVAQELARCKHPDKVLDALVSMIKEGEVGL